MSLNPALQTDSTAAASPSLQARASWPMPELNEACQQLIVTYVVARERASGEVNTQRGGNIYFQLYETGKQKLRPHMGGRDAYMLKNRW